ncbi:MAG: DUF992 domain-containing protein [Ancylobacter novellus]|uniref:DUF992 domain-containing protein n=1 Tax=Ancylobacter novellus TaxID=921 RepID=A0A2W5KLL7_ANCNO|nr:MAG: DUF992 domain-containing protein [Ancylobacter novellus]
MLVLFRSAIAAVAIAVAAPALAGPALSADATHPFVTIDKGRYEPVSGYQVGVLRCEIPGGIGYVVGSRRDVSCEYRPNSGRNAIDLYMGHIKKVGVDVGKTGPSVMTWGVVARTRDIGPGDLAGKYRGASASVAALIGGGANVLVGGSDITVSLQPLSFEGQTGLAVAAGYSSLTLNPI